MRAWIKPFLVGAAGTLTILLIVAIGWFGVTVWQGAKQGAAAFAYIQQAIQSQQKQAAPARPSPPTP